MYIYELDQGSFKIDDKIYWYHAEYPKVTIIRYDGAVATYVDDKHLIGEWKEALIEMVENNILYFTSLEK